MVVLIRCCFKLISALDTLEKLVLVFNCIF